MTATLATRRTAPRGGYDFATKQGFRNFVWRQIATRSLGRSSRSVALMPSSEGLEIDEAIRWGFAESDMHVVDRNAAIVAHLKRRYRDITTYGVDISRAHTRMGMSGIQLAGASIDLCGTAGWKAAQILAACSEADCWEHKSTVVINILRGREGLETRSLLERLARRGKRHAWAAYLSAEIRHNEYTTDRDPWRAWVLALGLPKHFAMPVATHAYLSTNGQTFLSIAFRMHKIASVCRSESSDALAVVSDIVLRNALHNAFDLSTDDSALIPAWALNNAAFRGKALDIVTCTIPKRELRRALNRYTHVIKRAI